jgi:signal peptidase I
MNQPVPDNTSSNPTSSNPTSAISGSPVDTTPVKSASEMPSSHTGFQSAAATATSGSSNTKTEAPQNHSKTSTSSSAWIRETVESLAVALILAFLFRAFVAEAFVIPTGSMAPTLMGAHKDASSTETRFVYQCGASMEFNTNTGANSSMAVVGTIDPLSRFEQPVDLRGNPNDTTFSGDRILVSKFSYLWSDPQRWDVVVFKYPRDARLNYIKRCVGMPNESLRVRHGDIYTRPKTSDEREPQTKSKTEFSIARKPPSVVEAMLQPVSDTDFLPHLAIEAGMPSVWQPSLAPGNGNLGFSSPEVTPAMTPIENGWVVNQSAAAEGSQPGPVAWSAQLATPKSDGSSAWLRYYHRVLSPLQWTSILETGKLPAAILPYSSRLISDFTAYNGAIKTERFNVFDKSGKLSKDYSTDWLPSDVSNPAASSYSRYSSRFETDGMHWAPDLACEFDIDFQLNSQAKEDPTRSTAPSRTLTLDLVEAGVHYQCIIDLNDGKATLAANRDGKSLSVFEGEQGDLIQTPSAATSLRASGKHTIKFANVDNTLHLWIDRALVRFSPSNRVRTDLESDFESHRPQSTAQDPLDAAPVGIGLSGVAAQLNRASVWRDVYYIAVEGENSNMIDNQNFDAELLQSVSAAALTDYLKATYAKTTTERFTSRTAVLRDALFSTPELWEKSPLFKNRETVQFEMGDGQFFPMGDNSAASSDARAWTPDHFVPRRLLIGRAVVVFWPHPWIKSILSVNIPIPNFSRIGLIR